MKHMFCSTSSRWSSGLLWCAAVTFTVIAPAGAVRTDDEEAAALHKAAVTGVMDLGKPHYSPAKRPRLADIPEGGIGRNFRLIEHNPLVNPGQSLPRGGNGIELGFVRNCLYVPSRLNNQGTLIVDITNPRRTVVRGSIPPTPSPSANTSLSTEIVNAIESENLLVRQYRSMPPPGITPDKGIEIYDTTDCFNPVQASTITLPDGRHENFLWQGGNPHRVLLFVSFTSSGPGAVRRRETSQFPAPPYDIDIRVYDLTDKYNPVGPVATWSLQHFGVPTIELPDLLENGNQAGMQGRNQTHSFTVSADGKRMYVAQLNGGFFIMDTSALTSGAPCDVQADVPPTPDNPFGVNPNACLKKLHPDPNARMNYRPPFGMSPTHSAYKVPGRPYAIVSDEPDPGPCPWSWFRVVFIDGERGYGTPPTLFHADLFPTILSAFQIPENDVEKCAENTAKFPGANFSAHKSLVFKDLVFVAWTAAGVRAIDISNPGTPFEAGFFFNSTVHETQGGLIDPELSITNHPVMRDGLLYGLDTNSGLYILKYTGPHSEDLPHGLFTPNAIQVVGRDP
jgi:hypothetical protein